MAKQDDTTFTAISFGNFVKNAESLRKEQAIEAAKRAALREMSRFRKRKASGGDDTSGEKPMEYLGNLLSNAT